MDIEQAFQEISAKLRAASERGIKPSTRAAGKDWVCTLEDKEIKLNVIAKEGELIMVTVQPKEIEPHLERYQAPGLSQQELIERIQKTRLNDNE